MPGVAMSLNASICHFIVTDESKDILGSKKKKKKKAPWVVKTRVQVSAERGRTF